MTYIFSIALTLMVILPTLLVLVLGQRLVSSYAEPGANRYIVLFGLTAVLLMAIPFAIFASQFQEGGTGLILLLVYPTLSGLLALMLINWHLIYETWRNEKVTVSLLLLGLLLVTVVITVSGDTYLGLLLLITPILTALLWIIGSRFGAVWLTPIAILLFAAMLLDAVGMSISHSIDSLDWLWTSYRTIKGITALLTLVVATFFVYDIYNRHSDSRSQKVSHLWLSFTLAALLLLSVGAVTFRHGMLSNATGKAYEDLLPLETIAAALICGLVFGFSLTRIARRAGAAYLLVIPLMIIAAYSLGWQVDYSSITAARAANLNQAISQYQQDTGEYPAVLGELTPDYLPVIFGPLTGRGQIWCYQSGSDYFRLGYVYYQRYYDYPDDTPFWEPYFEIKVPYTAGQPPAREWICDQELQRYKELGRL